MPGIEVYLLTLPTAAVDAVAADTTSAARQAPRDAEMLDLFASTGLEARLADAAPTLRLLAQTRPGRKTLGE